jgi:hypothetical protein
MDFDECFVILFAATALVEHKSSEYHILLIYSDLQICIGTNPT